MLKENKTDTANSLFRHEKVAEYFLSYVRVEGKEKVPVGIMNTLKVTLEVSAHASTGEVTGVMASREEELRHGIIPSTTTHLR